MASPVPRTLWLLWFQGWDTAPPVVRACLESWRRHNPEWTVRAMDAEEATQVAGTDLREDLSAAARSDLVRLAVLAREGGVWADATTYCMRPLDSWLPEAAPRGFFAFARPAPFRPISSWFLAAAPDSPVIGPWQEASERYWEGRSRADDYFWVHQAFSQVVRSDTRAGEVWEGTPSLSARGPHYFAPYGRRYTGTLTAAAQRHLAHSTEPLYKLTHRVHPSTTAPGSACRIFAAGRAGVGVDVLEPGDETWWDRASDSARWDALHLREAVRHAGRTARNGWVSRRSGTGAPTTR